ncbi:MAG TPA: molybdopterin-synthase adenylyltransferase MoeB [Thermoanaerobaculia bacterium]|jgi:adenylyltransferase/sulfurtransferase
MLPRYARQVRLPEFGEEGQRRLTNASALVIGAGGLGSPVSMYLTAAGVGRIGLVDFDRVDETNLHRQLLYGAKDVGRPKLEAARERLLDVNPNVRIELHSAALSSENALDILRDYDVVIDGTDNFPTRYLVSDACTMLHKPNVYGSVFRFEGQVSVFDADRGPCYRCLYPDPPPPHLVPSCAEAGVLGVLPGVIGMLQATETIKLLAGIGEPLIGKLLMYDALAASFRRLNVPKNCHAHAPVTHLIDYEGFCNPMDINAQQLHDQLEQGGEVYLLDVREPHEWTTGHLENSIHIPMRDVPARLAEIPRDRDVVVICRSGARSANVQQFLKANGITRVRNLIGGLMAWRRDVDPAMRVA